MHVIDSIFGENANAFPKTTLINLCIQFSNYCLVPIGSIGSEPAAQLSAEAQHHSTSVQRVDGHLARQAENTDNTERYVHICTCMYTCGFCMYIFLPV